VNHSGWHIRGPVLVLALIGCGIASYLAAYQLGFTSAVWDPIFGPASSAAVVDSPISRLSPVPDAAVGAFAYALEAVLTVAGGQDRWYARPWLVLAFGAVVAALALAGIALTLTQLVLVHAFCSLCLLSAAISFTNAALARDEVVASWRVLTTDTRRSIPT
jgi:uncharacterized membrane protein